MLLTLGVSGNHGIQMIDYVRPVLTRLQATSLKALYLVLEENVEN